MKINITIGFHRTFKGKDGTPVKIIFTGSTKQHYKELFDRYQWFRVTLGIPSNLSRPKILNWVLIPRRKML